MPDCPGRAPSVSRRSAATLQRELELPVLIRERGRIELVHVKDMDASKNMVDVGKGTINWAQIFAERDKAGIRHFFVEHDNPPVPLDSAKASYNYLSALTF